MRTSILRKSTLTLVATLALVTAASGDQIGPWPTTSTFMWENQPILGYTGGPVTVVTPPTEGVLNMPNPTGVPKNAGWLPYPSYAGERLANAQLVLNPGHALHTVHAKIYDPYALTGTGQNGWAILMYDNTGKILDFGIRPVLATHGIYAHQYTGSGTTWDPYQAVGIRTKTGNNYYTFDFDQNPNGTISWNFAAWENASTWNYSNTTTVSYGALTNILLCVATVGTTPAVNYKWTEFSLAVNYKLHIALQTPDVVLGWATNLPGVVLQQTATLPAGWGDVTNSPVVSNDLWVVTLPQDPAGQFFRLRPQ
jgi:hypothetical protein